MNKEDQVLNRIDALMDRFYTPQINQNKEIPTLTEFIGNKTEIPKNDAKIKENQEFINFLNKRLYAEISGILKILIPTLTEKIYKEFLEKQKQTSK